MASSPKIPKYAINVFPSCLASYLNLWSFKKKRGYNTIVHRVVIVTMTDLLKDMAPPVLALSHKFSEISANLIEDPGAPPILHGQSPLLSATRCSPPVAHSQLTPLNIPTQPPLPPSCQSDKHANTLHPSVYPATLSSPSQQQRTLPINLGVVMPPPIAPDRNTK